MYTEEYKGWKPWVCHGCSAELQFSAADGSILQLCFLVVALLVLYLLGVRGWHLVLGTVIGGFLAAFVFGAPLDRIMPRRLEPFRPPPWDEGPKFVTLFPHEDSNGDKPKHADQSEAETPKDSSGNVGNRV
jgi:hypothetical protein